WASSSSSWRWRRWPSIAATSVSESAAHDPDNLLSVSDRDQALRADIRRLGAQLGEALTRQHGPRLLELVEEVRALTKTSRQTDSAEPVEKLDALLESLDLEETIQLMRAFTCWSLSRRTAPSRSRAD